MISNLKGDDTPYNLLEDKPLYPQNPHPKKREWNQALVLLKSRLSQSNRLEDSPSAAEPHSLRRQAPGLWNSGRNGL
jgi:hypothetical protein